METILEFKDITYYYESGSSRIDILDQAACRFEPGKLYTIVGPSGSGKTTTLTLAGALESPRSGNVYYKGQDIKQIGYTKYRNRNIAIVFQAYNLLPYLTPLQNVMAAMEITKNPIPDKKGRAQSLLGRMGLTPDQMRRGINKLSGGEQQRVAIARALVSKPAIVLADEPTGNLDSRTSQDVLSLLKVTSAKFHQTLVMITHNNEIAQLADRIIRIEDGKIFE